MNENLAPVTIPTLCRYDHFKRLMESLNKCTWADKTDVYIGLDYPAKEEHRDGWMKIKRFLCEERFCFKKIVVFEREYNYGVKGENNNISALIKYVSTYYDRWIFSEDDNVFSPNFLVYINKGLEKFKNDKSVFAINGYRHFYNVKFKENTFFRQKIDFSAWGYGIWKDRYEQMTHNMTREYLRKCLYSFQKWKKVWECGWFKRSVFISNGSSHKPICFPDWMIGLYLTLENLDVIMPRISTVRNEGWDNSGLSCKISKWGDIAQKHTLQVIDESFDFQYVGTGLEYYNENKLRIFQNHTSKNIAIINKGIVPGVYHFSNEGVCSWYDFTVAIHRLAGITSCKVKPLHTAEYPTRANRPAYSVLDKTKIKTTFDIEIPHWEESLKQCIDKIMKDE